MKNQIIAVLSSKGGVAKSTTSEAICFTLASQDKKFNLIELDSSNDSHQMNKSSIFQNKIETIKDINDTTILNKLIKMNLESSVITVLDIGSGKNTLDAIAQFQKVDFIKISYVIPIDSSFRNLLNVRETVNLIGKNKDISFVLSRVFDMDKIEEQFLFFYGSAKYKIPAFKDNYPDVKYTSIPFSPFFEISVIDSQSIADSANISRNITFEDAVNHYQKTFLKGKDDEIGFDGAITAYIKSQEAKNIVDITIANLSTILKG